MSHLPSTNVSPKRLEEINVQQNCAQSSPKLLAQPQPQQLCQNYGQPIKNPQINGTIQTNGQQLQQIQVPMQRVSSSHTASPAIISSVGSTPQMSPTDNNPQFAQPPIHFATPGQQVPMQVLQQIPQQNLFHQQPQQSQQLLLQQQQQLQMGQQQNIINPQILGQQNLSLQQQQMLIQQQMIQQLYQPQLQQHVAMTQGQILYAAPTATVGGHHKRAATMTSNPLTTAAPLPPGPLSANNTPIASTVKKGRFRVVKQQQQPPLGGSESILFATDSVVSSTTENPDDVVATTSAITTKKKGRFLVKTKSVPDTTVADSVADTDKDDVRGGDAVGKGGGIGLPPQPPPPPDKVSGASSYKTKGRFRVKSGVNLVDVESCFESDKSTDHERKTSDDSALKSIPSIHKVASLGDITFEEGIPFISANSQLPVTSTNGQITGIDGGNIAVPQYSTFVVPTPYVMAQNTTIPLVQATVQQYQVQQSQQHQLQVQQQQQVATAQSTVPLSQPPDLPLSNLNSPVPKKGTPNAQPHELLPQTAGNAAAGSWRGISGSYGKNGRLIGFGGVGKVLHNLESLRQEVLEADKAIMSLQSDNRFLRNKNKELEAKISNLEKRLVKEKSMRRSSEANLQPLLQKVKDLETAINSGSHPSGEEMRDKMNEMASSIVSNCKSMSKKGEKIGTPSKQNHQTKSVSKPHKNENCDGGKELNLQPSTTKNGSSQSKVEVDLKPKSPDAIRRNLTQSMSDVDLSRLMLGSQEADPLAAVAPPVCSPTSSVVMTQNFQTLVDNNIEPIPQMPLSGSDGLDIENGQHFDPLGTPERNHPQLDIQSFAALNPLVPTFTQLNGSPVPVNKLPIATVPLPPQQRGQYDLFLISPGQSHLNQQGHDPFDDIVCRGQNGEQDGNGL